MRELIEVLADTDAEACRSSPAEMRSAVRDVTSAGARIWTGPWESVLDALQRVAAVDLCLARLVEGHADAQRILDQADVTPCPGVYGVWASRSAGTGLKAAPRDAGWALSGRLRFASGIDLIDRALAPGWLDDGDHLLFDVAADEVDADRSSWTTSAMDASQSFTVDVEQQVTRPPVGERNFYLTRPGFVVGGLGPAAVWTGGARGICELVAAGLRRFQATPHQLRRLGLMEQAVWTAELALGQAPATVARGGEASRMASRVRTAVVLAADVVLAEAPVIVGPAGLSTQPRLARALADLGIYVRQHHLDLELADLGAAVVSGGRTTR